MPLGSHLAALPPVVARSAVASGAGRLLPPRYGVRPGALEAAIEWLCLSHDVTDRHGSSMAFSLISGWRPAYPETTGYIIGTLLEYARRTHDDRYVAHARTMGNWEISIQAEDGGIMGGFIRPRPRPSIAFNTGMVLHGWLDLHHALGEDRFLGPAERAGRFLVETQDSDGAWRGRHSFRGIPHVYKSRVAWALIRLSEATGDDGYRRAALRNLEWVLAKQRENGWFECCEFQPGQLPNTHGIAYTLRGLLESHVLVGEPRLLDAVLRASEVLIRKLEVLGTLPATFDSSWRPQASYVCVTGLVQLGGVWLRLYQLTGDARFLNAGLKAVDGATAFQERRTWKPLHGPLPGSFPIWGRYAPLQYPNWATKFLADSLMLRDDCVATVA